MEKPQARSFNFLVPSVGLEEFSTPELSVQSVPITTIVASSNPVYGEVYSMQNYVMFVSDFHHVFSGYPGFLHQ